MPVAAARADAPLAHILGDLGGERRHLEHLVPDRLALVTHYGCATVRAELGRDTAHLPVYFVRGQQGPEAALMARLATEASSALLSGLARECAGTVTGRGLG
jgi:hypothetical protein